MSDDSLAGRRILVVEDEMFVASLIEELLENFGCDVVASVARPAQALKAIESLDIDAALLDLNLGGHDGTAVAARLEERGIPFVFATGYGGEAVEARFPGRPVLVKPFSPAQLRDALRSVLGLPEGGG